MAESHSHDKTAQIRHISTGHDREISGKAVMDTADKQESSNGHDRQAGKAAMDTIDKQESSNGHVRQAGKQHWT
jgi:hypothetical protein